MNVAVKAFPAVGFCANCYAAECAEDIALVDVGCVSPSVEEYLKKNGDRVKYILLTHDHFDHICGVEKAAKLCKNAAVVVHKNDESGLNDPHFSLCDMAGVEQPHIKADITIDDGQSLPFGDGEIRVMHTPGHTDGSVCYIMQDIIFSGDTLFCGSVGRTDFVSGSYTSQQYSLRRLAELSGEYTVYCGHGEVTTLSAEKCNNPFFKEL